jgi:hypothetical protein
LRTPSRSRNTAGFFMMSSTLCCRAIGRALLVR